MGTRYVPVPWGWQPQESLPLRAAAPLLLSDEGEWLPPPPWRERLALWGPGAAGALPTGPVPVAALDDGRGFVASGRPVTPVRILSIPWSQGLSRTISGTVCRGDPTLLPVANGQSPNNAAYNALSVASQAAGYSYNDPVTNVKIWKVTSSTVPNSNSGAGHDYSDGGNEVSLGWGPNNNTHTILIGASQGTGNYYLVDFTRGVGFNNYRQLTVQPLRDICFSFSNLASQPRIAYIMTSTQIIRYNTATMATENTGFFPFSAPSPFAWMHHDKNDTWFTYQQTPTNSAVLWNSQTNTSYTHTESWQDEPRLERDGVYVVLSGANVNVRWWKTDNTVGNYINNANWFAHVGNCRSFFVTADVNTIAPWAEDRYDIVGLDVPRTRILTQSAGTLVHHSGNWVQADSDLPGGNLQKQWVFLTGYEDDGFTPQLLWKIAVGAERCDGSDQRLVCHHYSAGNSGISYWAIPWGKPSPDGKVLIFNSNMNNVAGRYDLFVVELPVTCS